VSSNLATPTKEKQAWHFCRALFFGRVESLLSKAGQKERPGGKASGLFLF
jgi:hypothetical protein